MGFQIPHLFGRISQPLLGQHEGEHHEIEAVHERRVPDIQSGIRTQLGKIRSSQLFEKTDDAIQILLGLGGTFSRRTGIDGILTNYPDRGPDITLDVDGGNHGGRHMKLPGAGRPNKLLDYPY